MHIIFTYNFLKGSNGYKFAFQGQEAENELYGEGNASFFKYRVSDNRIGRFFAVDPLTAKYPYYSTYAFSGNRVIDAVELEGLEPKGYEETKSHDDADGFLEHTGTFGYNVLVGAGNTMNFAFNTFDVFSKNGPVGVWDYWNECLDDASEAIANDMIQSKKSGEQTTGVGYVFDRMTDPAAIASAIGSAGIMKGMTPKLKPVSSNLVSARQNLAKNWGLAIDKVDFSKPVYTKTIAKNTELIQYRVRGNDGSYGNYYAYSGTTPEQIGLRTSDVVQTYKVIVNKDTKAIFSSHKRNSSLYYDKSKFVEGGGVQIKSDQLKYNNNASFTEIK